MSSCYGRGIRLQLKFDVREIKRVYTFEGYNNNNDNKGKEVSVPPLASAAISTLNLTRLVYWSEHILLYYAQSLKTLAKLFTQIPF